MDFLAFIPARGGSKGIPNKNLVLLKGKPLIQYTVEAAKKSKYINEIFISSDDDKIINFCKSLGISVNYKRPSRLADDNTPMIDVVLDMIFWKKIHEKKLPDVIVLLQPTSPLRTSDDIDLAIEEFVRTNSETLISVNLMREHPYECIKLDGNKWSYLEKPSTKVSRRQDYEKIFYFINGAIYIAKTSFLVSEKTFIEEGKSLLFFMESEKSVDIDDLYDLKFAESLISANHSNL